MSFDPDDLWVDAIQGLNHIPLNMKRRIYRLMMVVAVGFSYLIDLLLLILFSAIGTIQSIAPLVYGAAGIGHVALFGMLHWSGLSERFANRQMTAWQMTYAVFAQLLGIIYAPEITPFFLAILFIVFAFGTLRISFREAIITWFLTTVAVGVTLSLAGNVTLTVPQPNNAEYTLISVSFALILLRCIILAYYASLLRQQLYEKSRSFEQDATHDPLTGVLNRRVLSSILEEQISLHQRKSIPACVAMLDIDRFKSINDQHGHSTGDRILRTLTTKLRKTLRESDKLVRYGGEEFVIVLAATDLIEAEQLTERIRQQIESTVWKALPTTQQITISIGLTELLLRDRVVDPIARADQALYIAKRSGRNRVVSSSDPVPGELDSELQF